jgi:outer membrane protein assembly factor BamB
VKPFVIVALTAQIAFLGASDAQADWPQFRGPNCSGISTAAAPIHFAPGKNERWKADVGEGHSSPVVVGDSIFLTSSDKATKAISVHCLERANGKIRWTRSVTLEKIEDFKHPSFNLASSTPTTDGERVVAYFGSYGLVCYDLKGTKQWDVRLPVAKSFSGNAVSPIIAGDKVILYRADFVEHALIAVDKRTGAELWRKPQHGRFTSDQACSATPVVHGDSLIVHGMRSVRAFKLADGESLWEARCKTSGTSSPVIVGDDVVVATWNQTGEPSLVPVLPTFKELLENHDKDDNSLITPKELPKLMYFQRSEGTEAPMNGHPLRFPDADKNKNKQIDEGEWAALLSKVSDHRRKNAVPHGLVAIPVNSKGVLNKEDLRYLARKNIPEVPSPIVYKGRVYLIKNGGVLSCIDLKSGEQLYRMRTGGTGTHYASPVIAGDKLYLASGDGTIVVMDLSDDKAETVATNKMGDGTYATPAIVDGVIYVRTHNALYAFGE